MNIYDFDTVLPRLGTGSLKYDDASRRGKPDGLTPLWVADMDFRVAEPITEALRAATSHGIHGYVIPDDAYFDALRAWMKTHHSYDFDARAVTITPGIVFALAQAVRAFSAPGDAILVQRPVYYPFSEVINDNKRRLVSSPLRLTEADAYEIDFEDFERRLCEDKPRLFIMCSPHNPVGRVWRQDELVRIGELCRTYNCLVISDEIHADFTFPGYTHTVFSAISDSFRENCITCTSPSKSFNLAGLQLSNIIIEDETLRRRFQNEVNACGYSQPNIMGLTAGRAAYESGAEWFDALLAYIGGNLDAVRAHFPSSSNTLDTPRLIEPEGTYLSWVDFRGLGLSHEEIERRLVNEAGVWLDSGTIFGPEGEGFQRINMACPRSVLEDALTRMSRAFAV